MSVEPPPISPAGFNCVECGYDVSGTAVGGVCPECGKSVGESLRTIQIEDMHCSRSTVCMVLGILSLLTWGIPGPITLFWYYLAKRKMAIGGYSKSSHTMARAGLFMGIISTAMLAFICIYFVFQEKF